MAAKGGKSAVRQRKKDSSKHFSARRIKHRTFTGCDTCRRRKVKCDGARPVCMRCKKSNRVCAGYGIKLKYAEILVLAGRNEPHLEKLKMKRDDSGTNSEISDGPKRQRIPFCRYPRTQRYLYERDVENALDRCFVSEGQSSSFVGPFTCFRLEQVVLIRSQNIAEVSSENRTLSSVSQRSNMMSPAALKPSIENILNGNETNGKGVVIDRGGNNSIISTISVGSIISNGSGGSIISTRSGGSIISTRSGGSIISTRSGGSIISTRSGGSIGNRSRSSIISNRSVPSGIVANRSATNSIISSISASSVSGRSSIDSSLIGSPQQVDMTQKETGNEVASPRNLDTHSNFSNNSTDQIIPRKIWIHPKFQKDAFTTYCTLLGDVPTGEPDWETVKRVVFSDYSGITESLQCRIVDKVGLTDDQVLQRCRRKILQLGQQLQINEIRVYPSESRVCLLLQNSKIQQLMTLFMQYSGKCVPVSFEKGVMSGVVVQVVYKVIGELVVSEMDYHSDKNKRPNAYAKPETGPESGWSSFPKYCQLLRETLAESALALGAYQQYRVLYSSFGLYKDSRHYLSCFILLRDVVQLNTSRLLSQLTVKSSEDDPVCEIDDELIGKLIAGGMVEELLITLVLCVKVDEQVDVVVNFKLLYTVMQAVREKLLDAKVAGSSVAELLTWVKYFHFFYYATATIDVEHYQIKEPGFEDLDENYNVIKQFNFEDSFRPDEYARIEIQRRKITDGESDERLGKEDSDGSESEGSEYDESESEESEYSKEDLEVKLPARLANRPKVKDRPPRSFTVHFGFGNEDGEGSDGESDESDEEMSDGESDESDEGMSDDESDENYDEISGSNDNSYNRANKLQQNTWKSLKKKTRINDKGIKVDVLTGLTVDQQCMPRFERQQMTSTDKKIHIPNHPTPETLVGVSMIELNYALPMSLLDLMIRTITISNHRNWFLRKKVFPRNFPKFCCDLEDDLVSWRIPWDLYEDTLENEQQFHSKFHEALYHMIMCFYNAILMFFYRIIKDMDPSLLQNYVTSALTHMEKLRSISMDQSFSSEYVVLPSFWTYFLCGSDAVNIDIQRRYDSLGSWWFNSGSKWIGRQMMLEIWRGRNYGMSVDRQISGNSVPNSSQIEASEETETSWLDLVKGWEMSGFH
ncbi:hypothetical protein HII12_003937 [Brettanomyces bruxellensis]|uniref:Zn(2)-C6 fungal-type domain-containing protein n=1 Tax=Dekkera bruxellensis TaxID=5007 RepID=A0A8H6ESK1_DEKBR|nr:hypothetical protein HII12_003937 [Brettanomyces bruxellensis]